MPAAARKSLYTSLIAQAALLAIHTVFAADAHDVVETVVLNGHVEAVDPRTGQVIHPCLLTVWTTRDLFAGLNLTAVDPAQCLKGLNAAVSRSPSELVPVRPLIEFDMADPRFITETDVLSTLDTRPNLMELTPSEFEALITNLFERMGLETRLTQPPLDQARGSDLVGCAVVESAVGPVVVGGRCRRRSPPRGTMHKEHYQNIAA
jgi:restriction system protein